MVRKLIRKWEPVILLLGIVTVGIFLSGHLNFSHSAMEKQTHALMHKTINTQLELFKLNNNGQIPRKMSKSDWSAGSNLEWQYYFPHSIPQLCNRGTPWIIDATQGKVDTLAHSGHE